MRRNVVNLPANRQFGVTTFEVERPPNFDMHFQIWLTFELVWQSLAEFRSVTAEEGVRD